MGIELGDIRYPKVKPAPVVFCIDVTASMTFPVEKGLGKSRMELANDLVETFIRHILSVPKPADAVEVAFVLFAHEIVLETEFVRLKELSAESFRNAQIRDCWHHEKPWDVRTIEVPIIQSKYTNSGVTPRFGCCDDKGSMIDSAILYCYEKIRNYTKDLYVVDDKGQKRALFYAPHFVLITDGDPEDTNPFRKRDDEATHQKARDMIYDHCYSGKDGMNLVVPITVGVFGKEISQDAVQRTTDYGENFEKGFFRVRDEKATVDFQRAAEFLCKTVVKSMSLAWGNSDKESKANPKGKRVSEIFVE